MISFHLLYQNHPEASRIWNIPYPIFSPVHHPWNTGWSFLQEELWGYLAKRLLLLGGDSAEGDHPGAFHSPSSPPEEHPDELWQCSDSFKWYHAVYWFSQNDSGWGCTTLSFTAPLRWSVACWSLGGRFSSRIWEVNEWRQNCPGEEEFWQHKLRELVWERKFVIIVF